MFVLCRFKEDFIWYVQVYLSLRVSISESDIRVFHFWEDLSSIHAWFFSVYGSSRVLLVVVPISFLFVYLLIVWTLLHLILLKSFWVMNDALQYKTHLLISSIFHACCSCSLLVWTLCLVQISFPNNMRIVYYLGPCAT